MVKYVAASAVYDTLRTYDVGETIDPSEISPDGLRRGMETGTIKRITHVGTAAELAARSIPGYGTLIYETDTTIARIGDGVTEPALLPVIGEDGFAFVDFANVDPATGRAALGITGEDGFAFVDFANVDPATGRAALGITGEDEDLRLYLAMGAF